MLGLTNRQWATTFSFFGIVIAILAVIFLVIGVAIDIEMQSIFSVFFKTTLFSSSGLLKVLQRTTPLTVAGLGLAVAFNSKFWNIGGEGQIVVGALVVTGICLFLGLPAFILVPLALILSFLIGGAYSGFAGVIKAKWNVNEIPVTIMMNFLAFAILGYLINNPWNWGEGLYARTALIPAATRFPFIIRPLSTTFLLAIILVLVIYVLVKKTIFGYKIRVVGSNYRAAITQGINANKIISLSAFISGGVCALAGAFIVFGGLFRAQDGLSGFYGFYAIVVALLANNKPQYIIFAAFFMAFIIQGVISIVVLGVPRQLGTLVVGIMFVVAISSKLITERLPL